MIKIISVTTGGRGWAGAHQRQVYPDHNRGRWNYLHNHDLNNERGHNLYHI